METATAYTRAADSDAAGRDLVQQIQREMTGRADAMVVFASPKYDHQTLLHALDRGCRPAVMVGASSAGEFARDAHGEGMAAVLALRSNTIRFAAGAGRRLRHDPAAAAREMVSTFHGIAEPTTYRSALIMADALAGHASTLVDELTLATSGQYQFFGGGAGDNAEFRRTTVFHGTDVLMDAAVGLEILSDKPVGIGVSHGWVPAGPALRVTETAGLRLIGLNGMPAVEAFQEHAERTGMPFDTRAPIPFFLHNILGVNTGAGYRLRVPLAVDGEGGILCAAEIPAGSRVHIMGGSARSSVLAAEQAAQAALAKMTNFKPKTALFFDCVATRLRLGEAFASELAAVKRHLPGVELIGCNTHGQIARAEGQFGSFHNCTAVVCVLPE